jgi:hypothetical protein
VHDHDDANVVAQPQPQPRDELQDDFKDVSLFLPRHVERVDSDAESGHLDSSARRRASASSGSTVRFAGADVELATSSSRHHSGHWQQQQQRDSRRWTAASFRSSGTSGSLGSNLGGAGAA